mmetsp:Transcript_82692/g.229489  ORF Transcript_82692/g.229489 Transcript_82692/m.229489 type:complete len:255 (-) Transcript_82692:195-959(-)
MAYRSGSSGPRAPRRRMVAGTCSWSPQSTSESVGSSTALPSTWRRRATPSSRLSWSASRQMVWVLRVCLHSSSDMTRLTTSTTAGGRSPSRRATTSRSGVRRPSACARAAPCGGRRYARSRPTERGARTSHQHPQLPRVWPRLRLRRQAASPSLPPDQEEASKWVCLRLGRRRTSRRSVSASVLRSGRHRSGRSATATRRAWLGASGSAMLTGTSWSSCSAASQVRVVSSSRPWSFALTRAIGPSRSRSASRSP